MLIKNKLKTFMYSENRIIRNSAKIAYKAFMKSKLIYNIRYCPRMNDEKYIRRMYKKRFGVYPDLVNPKTFNEKNNWRKLHDRQAGYTDMVDKYQLKKIVLQLCGEGHTIPLLGVWDNPEEINFELLPEKFVLKPNHAGGVIVCREKALFNRAEAVAELKQSLNLDYFSMSREWPYKNVKRKIICEQYIGENLVDYKNYCFNGKLMYTFVWKNKSREDGRKPEPFFVGAFDREWNRTDIEIDYPSLEEDCEKPACYEELVTVAEKMSAEIPFVRVDCYIINNKVYVGEMTFFPWGGFMKFKDEKWNRRLGELERLPLIVSNDL